MGITSNSLKLVWLIPLLLSINIGAQEFLIDSDSKSGHWNLFMENPSGTKIAYVKFLNGYPNPAKYWNDAQIIVCDRNGENKKIIWNGYANPHAGALLRWIDDTHFVCLPDITVWNISNLDSPYVESIITHEYLGVEPDIQPFSFNDNKKLIVTGQMAYRDENSKIANVIIVDPFSGIFSFVLDANAFLPWVDDMIALANASLNLSYDPKNWYITHKYFNPKGNLIWIKLTVTDGNSIRGDRVTKDFGFSFNLNGQDIVFYNENPRSHPTWWNDERIFSDDGKINNRDGSYTGFQASGAILHPGLSPGRNLIAGETHPGLTPPTELLLYKRGSLTPLAIIFSTSVTNLIWGPNINGSKFHVNPSFSRDGKRIYYTKQIDEQTVGLFAYDIPSDIWNSSLEY